MWIFRATPENSEQGSYRSSIVFDVDIDKPLPDIAAETLLPSLPNSANQSDHSDHDHTDCPKNPYGDSSCFDKSLYFKDGNRSVDFVLVWKRLMEDHSAGVEAVRNEKRRIFQENLMKDGLEIEEETVEEEVTFIKVKSWNVNKLCELI